MVSLARSPMVRRGFLRLFVGPVVERTGTEGSATGASQGPTRTLQRLTDVGAVVSPFGDL